MFHEVVLHGGISNFLQTLTCMEDILLLALPQATMRTKMTLPMKTSSRPHRCHKSETTETPVTRPVSTLHRTTRTQEWTPPMKTPGQMPKIQESLPPKTPEVPIDKNPGLLPADAPTVVPEEATNKPPAPETYGDGRYPARDRSEIPTL